MPTRAPHVDPAFRRFPGRLGPFVLREELGRGATGVVYLADQDWPARRIALKIFHRGLASPEDREVFDTETAALAKLSHPGIAHLYQPGFLELDGEERPFLAMELVQGMPLRTWSRRVAPDLRTRVRLLAELCLAIDAAHRQGVVHRDLKPENVLVQVDGDAARPRVLDFGVAKLMAASRADSLAADDLVGTLDFMSPEQAARSPLVDGRSDVYSLGAIAYELLTGTLPIQVQGMPWSAALERIRSESPRRPETSAPRLPRDLATVLMTALAKSPDDRYASPRKLAQDFTAWLAHRPIAACAPTLAYRFACFARRQRLAATSIAVMAVSLAAAALAGWWAYAGIRNELVQRVSSSYFAIDEVIGRLQTTAGTSRLRGHFLQHLRPQIDTWVREQPDDRIALECQERVLRYLGDIEVDAGNWTKAAELRTAAEAASRTLLDKFPDDDDLRADWATSLVRIGDVDHAQGRTAAMVAAYERSHREFAALATAHPEDGRHLDDLEWSCGRLANHAIDAGDFRRAEDLLRERAELLRRLEVMRPDHAATRAGKRELASLWSHLEGRRGNRAGWHAHLQEAIGLAREWVRDTPSDSQATIAFATSVLSWVGHPESPIAPAAARPLRREALDAVDRLLAAEPDHAAVKALRQYGQELTQRLYQ